MRIIGGNYKGQTLITPEGDTTRPTTDRVRESLFNILNSLQTAQKIVTWEEQHVFDGFCGSGALGIESLSRGAKSAFFIDQDALATKACKKNLTTCKINKNTIAVKQMSLLSLKEKPDELPPYTMVFLDPPYGKSLGVKAINILLEYNWLSDNALIILETDKKSPEDIPDNVGIINERLYGRVRLQFLNIKQNNYAK